MKHAPSMPVAVPASPTRWMNLSAYRAGGYSPGRGLFTRALWYVIGASCFESAWLPNSAVKRWLLRRFGAEIGKHVVIKPHVRIKHPWRLKIGDHTWIGEGVWIDNLAEVRIGRDCCVSQGAYLCTGSHDYRLAEFDLSIQPIDIGDEAWIAARATVLPGAVIPTGVVVAAGSVIPGQTVIPEAVVVAGVPAQVIGPRLETAAESHLTMPKLRVVACSES